MWFDLNGDNIEYATDRSEIAVWHWSMPTEQIRDLPAPVRIQLDVFHATENKISGTNNTEWIKHAEPGEFVIVECHDPNISNPHIVFSDFLFNRTKAYYSQFKFRDPGRRWYYQHDDDFVLPAITRSDGRQRLFISASRLYHRPQPYRRRLIELVSRYQDQGYVSSDNSLRSSSGLVPGGYSPMHNAYYLDSFISIYAETLEWGDTIMVTEKTWDPLIKGHFILPFGVCGLIQDIKSRGFVFPDFIDYTYSTIADDNRRWQSYQNEVRRLISLRLDQWQDLWDSNLSMLRHNREVFFQRPYHKIDWQKLA